MKPESCENLQKKALDHMGSDRALEQWKTHSGHCEACAQKLKVWTSLQGLARAPVEGLGEPRLRAIRQALAKRHRPKRKYWGLWLSFAFGGLLLILAMVYLRPQDPFSLETSPSKWQQIASNPDWELETNDHLRHRIEAMRQDFRLAEPKPVGKIPGATKNLKNRLERFRNHLEIEE